MQSSQALTRRRADPSGGAAEPSASIAALPSNVVRLVQAPADPPSFTMRERIELLDWSSRMREAGIARVVIERPDPEEAESDIGDFILIYGATECWARWGIGRENGVYLLWRPADWQTLGCFDRLTEALETISVLH